MGNIVNTHRGQNIQPERAIATVKAASVFKAKMKETQANRTKASEEIEEVVKRKFRRKSTVFGRRPIGRLASGDESPPPNITSSQKDVLKFVRW